MKELSLEEAALAWAQGKRVQCLHCNHCHEDDWKAVDGVGECEVGKISQVVFGLPAIYRFRLAPEPPAKKFRPWTPEEVPVGAQAKTKVCDSEIQMIVGRNLLGVLLAQDSGAYPFRDMLELRLHSIDGGKTWMPCGVEVDA